MGGEFNAQIGRNEIDNSNVVGKFGYNYTNSQGEELVQWLRENDLYGIILFTPLEGEALGTIEVLGNGMSWMDFLHICKTENMW